GRGDYLAEAVTATALLPPIIVFDQGTCCNLERPAYNEVCGKIMQEELPGIAKVFSYYVVG
ncbi:MAG: hypothetical protein ACXWC7_06360, partial [Chitinophagaceae bacterium]